MISMAFHTFTVAKNAKRDIEEQERITSTLSCKYVKYHAARKSEIYL